jgi:germination protein M
MSRRSIIFLAVLAMAFGIFVGCQQKAEAPYEEIPASNEAEEPGYRRTVLYYEDDNGYVIPVMKKIKSVVEIGKAAVQELKQSAAGSIKASGLYAILPNNTKIELGISNKVATLNLSKGALNANNALEETNKVVAIVNTLTEFPSIEKVQFLIDGKKVNKLKFGTDISKAIGRYVLNPESADPDMDIKSAVKLTLYFSDKENTHIVPVTRYFEGKAGVAEAVKGLLEGPKDAAFLQRSFPEDTKLLEAKLDDKNAVNLNFSKEFNKLMETPQMEKDAIKTLYLTCFEFDSVSDVNILVEGKPYEGSAPTMTINQYPNTVK